MPVRLPVLLPLATTGRTPFMKEDELIVFGEDIVVEIERIDADMAAPVVTGQMAGGLRPTSY